MRFLDRSPRRSILSIAVGSVLGVALVAEAAGQRLSDTAAPKQDQAAKDVKEKDPRPKTTVRAQPMIAMSPARVVVTAELSGGAGDFEEYYCPTVEWDWGDDTRSESTSDCEPYEAGKSEIKRRFTVEHIYRRAGNYRISFRMKRHDKTVGAATTNVQIRPGLHEIGN